MNKFYQYSKALTLLSFAGFSLAKAPESAWGLIQAESNSYQLQQIKLNEESMLKRLPASELKRAGWIAGVDVKDYISALSHQEMMVSSLDDHFDQLGYEFSEVNCVIADNVYIGGEKNIEEVDVASSHCIENKYAGENWNSEQHAVYLIEVNFTEVDLLDHESKGQLKIKNELHQDILINREVKVDSTTLFNRQMVAVSNQCSQVDQCSTALKIESNNSQGLIEAKLVGVYYPNPEDKLFYNETIMKTPQFINGDFSNGSSNWQWRQEFTGSNCPNANSINSLDPVDNRTPEVRTRFGNPYAYTGGFLGSPNITEWYGRSTIHQTVQVPNNAILKFNRRIKPGNRGVVDLPVNMYLGLYDVTKDQFRHVYYKRTDRFLDFETIEVDMSAYANHTVKFRFEACSQAITSIQSAYHGSIGIDNIRFEITTPVEPAGTLSSDSPCVIPSGASKCDTVISSNTTNTPYQCMWLRSAKSLVSCSSNASNSVLWPHTNVNGHIIDLKSHDVPPSNTSSAYDSAPLLDSIEVVAQAQSVVADQYDDLSSRGFTDDVVGDAEPIFVGAAYQTHNFHDQGDQDWLIFAMPIGEGVDIETTKLEAATPLIRAYRINLNNIVETSPGRRVISTSNLIPVGLDVSSGNNKVTIQNTSYELGFYAVKIYASTFGENTDYRVRSVRNNPIVPVDQFDDVSLRGYTDDMPGDAVPLFSGEAAQQHNFHDSGDVDWTIFAMAAGSSIQVQFSGMERAHVQYEIYKLPGAPAVISAGRWDINPGSLDSIAVKDTRLEDQLNYTINNPASGGQGYYVIKSKSTGPSGFKTNYKIRSVGL